MPQYPSTARRDIPSERSAYLYQLPQGEGRGESPPTKLIQVQRQGFRLSAPSDCQLRSHVKRWRIAAWGQPLWLPMVALCFGGATDNRKSRGNANRRLTARYAFISMNVCKERNGGRCEEDAKIVEKRAGAKDSLRPGRPHVCVCGRRREGGLPALRQSGDPSMGVEWFRQLVACSRKSFY